MSENPPPQFGAELRRRRLALGISLGELSRRLHYSKSYLSKIENGLKEPSVDLARRCDAIVEAGGELAAIVVPREVESVQTPEVGLDDVLVMRLDASGRGEFGAVERRKLLLAAGTATLASWVVAPTPAPRRHESETLVSFRRMFDEVRALGQSIPAAMLLPTVVSQTHMLRVFAADAPPSIRNRTFVLAARFAEYAGWMAQEAGSEDGALRWTEYAVQLAAHGGDEELAAYALVRRALIAMYRDDAMATVELAQGAQASHFRPRLRGLAAQREAQGHAIAGDYNACRRSLDRAAKLLQAAAADDEQPVLGTSTIDDPVAMVTGWCLYDLGRADEAAQIIQRELARMPAGARRARARFAARRALALAGAGEVEQACVEVRPVLEALSYVDSATVRVELRHFARQLNRWHSLTPVRELMPQLNAALRTTIAA